MTTDRTITLDFEHAQRIFDALVNSMDFGSGFLETDDVVALRALAEAIGVDPNIGTPSEFAAQYPHPYDGETDRQRIAWQSGALTQTVAYSVTGAPYTVNVIDDAKLPDFSPCKVGPHGRWCGKPEDHEIHQAARLAAESTEA
jgi:hypothetical protein